MGCLACWSCLIEWTLAFDHIFLFLPCSLSSPFLPVRSPFSLHLHLICICLFWSALHDKNLFLLLPCPLSPATALSLGWLSALTLVLLCAFLASDRLPWRRLRPHHARPSVSLGQWLFLTLSLPPLCPASDSVSFLGTVLSLHVWPLFAPSHSLWTWPLLLLTVHLSPSSFHHLPHFSSLQT